MYNRKNMEMITNKIMEIKELVSVSGFDNKGTIEVLLDGALDGIKQESLVTMMQQQYLN